MHRTALGVVCLSLFVGCPGSRDSTTVPVATPPVDFSGFWTIQLVILQDECGFCPTGTAVVEGLKIDQMQDTVAATLSGLYLKTSGSGSVTGPTMNLDFSGSIFVNSWYFVDSPASASCFISNGTIQGALFVQLGNLGECCDLCCGGGQCLCKGRDCRVTLPDCKMTFTLSGFRILS